MFGSWCEPCHYEHPYLMALAADDALKQKGVVLYGVAQKDFAENVRRFLGAEGDPYAKVGLDPDGRAGIDWGVYGVPETFIVRGDGTIAYKFVGPMTAEALESEVKPQILKAMDAAALLTRRPRNKTASPRLTAGSAPSAAGVERMALPRGRCFGARGSDCGRFRPVDEKEEFRAD